MELDTMFASVHERVATITLNRPRVLNCINEQWTRDLHSVLDWIVADEAIRIVVVRGAGRAFCTGIDVTALSEGAIAQGFFRDWELALRRIETMNALAISAVHSHCIGGGLQLALACDFRVARADARFGITAVKEGIVPGMGMWRLARYAGLGRARRLALSAETIEARTAYDWGLIDAVADEETFERTLSDLIERLLTMAWTSTYLTKALTNQALDLPFAEFLAVFEDSQRRAIQSAEHREAMAQHRAARAAGRSSSSR